MPPPDYTALKAELASPDLSGLSDDNAAAKLASDRVTLPSRAVPVAEVEALAFRRGVIGRLYAGADSAVVELKAACRSALALFSGRLAEMYMDDPAVSGLLDGLEAGGVITADDRAALLALANRSITRAESIPGWGIPVTAADVAHARSL